MLAPVPALGANLDQASGDDPASHDGSGPQTARQPLANRGKRYETSVDGPCFEKA